MSYRVLIPTAGTGSRLGNLTKFVNKSLVSIGPRPTISRIIEMFPLDSEFVIALGHKGHLIKEFLQLAYPNRVFFYADVNPFEGHGSGLGLSILACKPFLQQPFVFVSCDTLVKEHIPAPTHNWMGFAEKVNILPYRTLDIKEQNVLDICEKGHGKSGFHKPYIGLAGIFDFKAFWNEMEAGGDLAIKTGEAHGMRAFLPQGIKAYCFSWFDTGNPEALSQTRENFREIDAPNILDKANEAIWFIEDNVIKFSDDTKFIANRVARVKEMEGFIPEVTGSTPHMYRYVKAQGKVFSEIANLPLFSKLLQYSKHFWKIQRLSIQEGHDFRDACMRFYKNKTIERVELFYKNFNKSDGTEMINGVSMPSLKQIFENINWNWLADGVPGRFHGDFHFENIIFSEKYSKFIFLDWRQEFGGSLSTGDIYYDFAKLLHGLIICHELIAKNHFSVNWGPEEIYFDFFRKQVLVDCEKYFLFWLEENQFDKRKVIVLTALIYLNIAALHHFPYSLLLFSLGKSMLANSILPKRNI